MKHENIGLVMKQLCSGRLKFHVLVCKGLRPIVRKGILKVCLPVDDVRTTYITDDIEVMLCFAILLLLFLLCIKLSQASYQSGSVKLLCVNQ